MRDLKTMFSLELVDAQLQRSLHASCWMLCNALRSAEPPIPRRTLGSRGQVFRYGFSTDRCERDISHDLRGSLGPVVEGHFSAVTEPWQIAGILRAIDDYKGTFVVQCAMRLAPLVFVPLMTEYAQQYLDGNTGVEPRLESIVTIGGSRRMRQPPRQQRGLIMSISVSEGEKTTQLGAARGTQPYPDLCFG